MRLTTSVVLVVCFALFAGTSSAAGNAVVNPGAETLLQCTKGYTYRPVPPFTTYTYSAQKTGDPFYKDEPWPTDKKSIIDLLPNIASDIAVLDVEGKANFYVGKVAAKGTNIAIDFVKYRTEPIHGALNVIAFARVGVGVRLLINVKSGDLDVGGSLAGLAASVKAKGVAGTISASLIGISAKDAAVAVPFTSDLTDAAIERIIEAMAIVKSKMSDDTTVLAPQTLAIIECKT